MKRFIVDAALAGSLFQLLTSCSQDSNTPSPGTHPGAGGSEQATTLQNGGSRAQSTSEQGGAESGGASEATDTTTHKGGASSSGGSRNSGGGSAKTSGTKSAASGGTRAVGGGSSNGGSGIAGSTASGGGSHAGGASSATSSKPQICAWDDGPSATNGGLTCYWFSQGTSKDEKTCPGGYKTYCGYCGSETGEKPQEGQIWCPINDIVSTVKNIATTHFVAIPPTPLEQGKNCGACVEVTYAGRSIVATVVDACPSCLSDQHIDLSLSAAKALGMNEMMGQVESGVKWRIVGCPTTSNIVVGFNGGYQGQVYFQNAAFPIASAKSGSSVATVNTGFWDFGKEMGGQEVSLTDVMGHTVTATIPTNGGDLGVQFDLTCQ